jgi:hypothetical protein
LGVTLNERQIKTIIKKETNIPFQSDTLELYPSKDAAYPYLILNGEYYIRARLLMKYLAQNGIEYTISLPEREPVVVHCSKQYRPNVDMFENYDHVFIKQSCLQVEVKPSKNGVQIDV